MGAWHMDMGSGWWILGPIMMVLFWGGVFWLLARPTGRRESLSVGISEPGANEIAARHFASGEINEAEYSRITDRLEK